MSGSNLFLTLSTANGYVRGIFVDYLIPKLYLSDCWLLVGVLAAMWLYPKQIQQLPKDISKQRTAVLLATVLWGLFLVRQFFTPNPVAAIWFWLEVSILAATGLSVLYVTKINVINTATVWKFATLGFWWQIWLLLWQWLTHHSFLPFFVSGEPNLQVSYLAHGIWNSTDVFLPYGSTSHPNVAAGWLVLLGSWIWWFKPSKTYAWYLSCATLLATGFGLFLTQSWAATMAAVVAVGVFVISQSPQLTSMIQRKDHVQLRATVFLCLFIAMPIFIWFAAKSTSITAITRRAWLQTAAIDLFEKNPIWGIGLNQFTVQLETVATTTEVPRFLQPVHHVGLLWLSETGMYGAMLVVLFFWFTKDLSFKNLKIVAWVSIALPLLALDHYLLTQRVGAMIFVLVLSTTLLKDSG